MKVNKPNINKPRCSVCGSYNKVNYSFYAMIFPHPESEELIDKWGRDDWWKNLERKDLTKNEEKELDSLTLYDQALNTVGRDTRCIKCETKENELLTKYYPR